MFEKTKTVYVCEVCGAEWDDSATAKACEESHRNSLRVVDMKFQPDDEHMSYGFPERIVVDDPSYSGCAAEYVLSREGSVEEFEPYHPPEFYEYD